MFADFNAIVVGLFLVDLQGTVGEQAPVGVHRVRRKVYKGDLEGLAGYLGGCEC